MTEDASETGRRSESGGNGGEAPAAPLTPGQPAPLTSGQPAPLTPGQRLEAERARKAAAKARKRGQVPHMAQEMEARGRSMFSWLALKKGPVLVASMATFVVVAVAVAWWWSERNEERVAAALLAKTVEQMQRPVAGDPAAAATDAKPFSSAETKTKKVRELLSRLDRKDLDGPVAAWEALIEGRLLLDAGKYAEAQRQFMKVEAEDNPALNAKAVEGLGAALEGQKNYDAAYGHYRRLSTSSTRALANLGKFHMARVRVAAGQKEEAKKLLLGLIESPKTPAQGEDIEGAANEPAPDQAITDQARALLASIDPSLVKGGGAPGGGAGQLDPARLQQLLQQLQAGQPPSAGE